MLKNRVVLGIEGDGSFPTFSDPVSGLTIGGISNFTSPTFGAGTFSENVLASGTLRGRIGYAPGHWLFYATGGLAWSYDQQELTQNATGNVEDRFVWRFGWALGAGIETAITPNWTVRGECLWTDFPSFSENFPLSGQRVSSGLSEQQFRLGLNYRFDDSSWPAALAPSHFAASDNLAVHGQATFVDQAHPAFRAPFDGPNSLTGGASIAGNLRSHALRRRQAVAGCGILGQSGNRPGLWLRRHPWRGRLYERRSLQDRFVHALCPPATRLPAADHQSRRRHRKGRRRFLSVQGDTFDRPPGADGRTVLRRRYFRYKPLRQQSEVRFPELVGGQYRQFRLRGRRLGLYLRRRCRMVHRALDLARRRVRSFRFAHRRHEPAGHGCQLNLPAVPVGRRNRAALRPLGRTGQGQVHRLSEPRQRRQFQ